MKKLLIFILAMAGLAPAQVVYDGGHTTISDTTRWGDTNDSSFYLLIRKTAKFRDSTNTWRALSGFDSCSLPQRLSYGQALPASKLELAYEVRTSSGNTDSSQIKIKIDSRYCRETGTHSIDTTKCESWVSSGRFRGDTSSFVMDSLITVATTSGTTWKPTRQIFDVPGGTQIRLCVDGFKTGSSATDSTFFRRFVIRNSAVKAGGIPPSAVSVSGATLSGAVDLNPGSNIIGALVANQSVNVAQHNGVTAATGSGTATGALRVELPTNGTGTIATVGAVTNITNPLPAGTAILGKVGIDQTTPGTTNGVQVNAALPAGSAIIGNVRIDQTTPGTTNGVQVNAALPAGTNAIGKLAANDGVDVGDVTLNGAPTGSSAIQLQGSTASGATDAGNPVKFGGKYNSSPVTLTDGQRGDAQLDANGYLKINVAAGGASGGTSSSFGSSFPATGTAVGFLNSAGTNMAAGNLDASGYLKVNVAAGGGAGGTSSSVGSAVPSTATAAGVSDGTNLQLPRAFDTDAGAGTQYTMGVSLRKASSGGSVEAGTSSDPLRTDPTGTTTQPVSLTSTTITGTVASTQSGTWTVQPGNTANTTAWKVDGSAVTQPVSGTVTANAGSGTFTTSGTVTAAATSIGKAEDVASADADVGVPAFAVRKATPANTSGTDGDYEALQMSAGRLWTSSTIDAALPAGSAVIGKVSIDQATPGTTNLVAAGQNGTWTVQPGNTANTTAWKVDNSAVNQPTVGAAAQGASVSGAPVLQGIEGRSTVATAVTDGQAARAVGTVDGKQVFMPYAIQAARWSSAAASGGIVNTTGVTIKAAAGANIRNCVTDIDIENGHATVSTEVVLRDGASGTVIKRWWAQAAGGGIAKHLPVPLCGTANTLLEVAAITTGSAVYVNAGGYSAAE